MRTYPDDPEIQAMLPSDIRKIVGENVHACQGCPFYLKRGKDLDCPHDDSSIDRAYWCGNGTYWFGHHIFIANKLEHP